MVRALLAVAGVSGALAGAWPTQLATPAPPLPRLLGMVGERPPLSLVRLDPQTLQPLAGRPIAVGSGGCAPRQGGQACWTVPPWSFSPDRALLAVARNDRLAASAVRIVDVGRMRVAADLRLGGGPVGALAWLAPRRLLAVQELVCCPERQRVLTVDLAGRRVVGRRALGGSVLGVAATPQELVLLVAPAGSIGPARLAVADSRGAVRFVRLAQIQAGIRVESSGRFEHSLPGLAVDPAAGRAFVVGERLLAEIDLRGLTVSYHQVGRPLAAPKKETRGSSRSAAWLGNGLLALSGADANGGGADARPAGLQLVDTSGWAVRTVDRRVTGFVVAGDLLLATGRSDIGPIGIAAYGLDGVSRFHLFDGEYAWVAQADGNVAYVGVTRPDGRQDALRIVDLGTGGAIGERTLPLPWLVLDVASGWWGG